MLSKFMLIVIMIKYREIEGSGTTLGNFTTTAVLSKTKTTVLALAFKTWSRRS